ncbi:MAG: NAD(P)H-hydrate epimerase [Oscillospiraceae bacterium]|nr:NAD(P)H-hydrate epimerase [Oscillospiraceae bacterium]
MLDCISVENMRESDRRTIEAITPSLTLMHRAAMGVYLAHDWRAKTGIVTGSGNNGGDGWALACILRQNGRECAVLPLSDRLSPDGAHYAEKAKALGVPVIPFSPEAIRGCDTVVDCLLGTGFQGPVRDSYAAAIAAINESGSFVVSVDINSGLNGDTGEGETAVRSDLTVTVGFLKNGLVTASAARYMKRLVVADIGIALVREENKVVSISEWRPEYEDSGRFLRQPPYLDMNVIDVRRCE